MLTIASFESVKWARRTGPPMLEGAALAAGAVTYELSLFFLATGHGYRYSYPAVLLGTLASVIAFVAALTTPAPGPQAQMV